MFTELNPDPDKIIYSHFTQATGALLSALELGRYRFLKSRYRFRYRFFKISRYRFRFSARTYHCLSNNTIADTLRLPLSPEWGLGPRICITNCGHKRQRYCYNRQPIGTHHHSIERYYRRPAAPSPSPKMGNGVPKICIAICGQAVTASDIVTIDSLPPSLSICAISDPLSLPVPPTWGARFHDCRPKRQCAGDAAFAKLLWPLLRLIMVSLPLPGVVEFHIFIS